MATAKASSGNHLNWKTWSAGGALVGIAILAIAFGNSPEKEKPANTPAAATAVTGATAAAPQAPPCTVFTGYNQDCPYTHDTLWVDTHKVGTQLPGHLCVDPLPTDPGADYTLFYVEEHSSEVKVWEPGLSGVRMARYGFQAPEGKTERVSIRADVNGC